MDEQLDQSFVRTQETVNHQVDRTEKQWEAIRDECVSGGAMDDRCSIVAASLGTGTLEVVAKRLSCGCILVPAGSDEVTL
jgi:hypothetical protein